MKTKIQIIQKKNIFHKKENSIIYNKNKILKKKEEKEKQKLNKKVEKNEMKDNNILEKSDDINLICQKKEIMSYNNYLHPNLNKEKETISNKITNNIIYDNKTDKYKTFEIFNHFNKKNNYLIKVNNFINNNNNNLDNKNKYKTNDETKKNRIFSNSITFPNKELNKEIDENFENVDEIKIKYNKNRNKVSSTELIQKLEKFSKKESIKNGNKNNLYEIKDELIIIDNENPKDNIFNTIVEEIYTNKASTKALDINIKK